MNPPKIVCMGDSLTEGYLIDLTTRWSDQLAADLNIDIINSGICGDTTAGMLARFHPMVLAHEPTHVIIMGGTNDISYLVPENQIISNIGAMIRLARHHDIISIIGIPTRFMVPPPLEEQIHFLDTTSISKQIDAYREKLKQYAIDGDWAFIDFSMNLQVEHFLADGVHPNEAGHAVMKENVKSVLQELLRHPD